MPRTEEANRIIREERRREIYAAAAAVFARNGYVGTRVEDIAAATGISKGLIYHYFGGKEVLFTALIERAAAGTLGLYRGALTGPGTAAARLHRLLEEVVEGLADHPDMFVVVVHGFLSEAVPAAARTRVRRLVAEGTALLSELVAAGQQAGDIVAGDPELLALTVQACISGLATARAMGQPVPPIAETLTGLLAARR